MSFDNFESFAFRPIRLGKSPYHMYHMHQPWSKAKLGRQAAVVVRQSFLVSPVHPAAWPAQPDVGTVAGPCTPIAPATSYGHLCSIKTGFIMGATWRQAGHIHGCGSPCIESNNNAATANFNETDEQTLRTSTSTTARNRVFSFATSHN